jgi:hypothetical protein
MAKKKTAKKSKRALKKTTNRKSAEATVKELVERHLSLRAMVTVCALTRDDVSRIVVLFVRAQGFPAATEFSDFTTDIPVDPITRRGWAAPIRQRIFAGGCDPKGFGPSDCQDAENVGGIVDALAAELQ